MGKKAKSASPPPPPETDIWRDSPLRYLGYANEVGESFRYVFPHLVAASYALSFGYVAGDVIDKTRKAYLAQGRVTPSVMVGGLDCFAWQTLASVLVPGALIHKVVDATTWGVSKATSNSAQARVLGVPARAIPVAVGLATIPFIVEPIDHAVTIAMDSTVRKVYPRFGLNVQGLGMDH